MELSVYFDNKDKTLYGEVMVSDQEAVAVTPAVIEQRVAALGYGELTLNPQAVDQLCASASHQEVLKVPLKRLIDGEASVQVSADKRQATLTIHKADGGTPADLEAVEQCLSDAGISEERVDRKAIDSALDRGQVSELVIAKAKPPVDGRDAVYLSLVASELDREPVVDEQGVADMLSAHVFILVDIGEPLMRREPATPGEPGIDVMGEAIAATPGADPGFRPDLQGAEISADDPDLLIAASKGHPVLYPNGVSVDPVLHVDNVDLHTGNINFDGSLEVKGDVAAGLEIEVTGDVMVKGAVERAHVVAGNDVVVQGGIFGRQTIDEETGMSGEDPDTRFDIKAGGNVNVGFMNQVAVHAQGDIRIKQYSGHSFLKAEGLIELGQDGGKGILFGGLAMAKKGAVVAQAGNDAFMPTRISLGISDHLRIQLKQIEQQLEARQTEVSQLQDIFDKIKTKEARTLGKVSMDKTRRIANTITAIRDTIETLNKEAEALHEAIESQREVCLRITRRLCPNTTLSIHGVTERFSREHKADSWREVGYHLVAASETKGD